MGAERALFLHINGWAGQNGPLDWALKAVANDYLVPVVLSLFLLWLWFASPGTRRVPLALLAGVGALGLGDGLIKLMNFIYYRPRPFTELPVRLIFYRPLDSSFPSNGTAVAFILATAIFLGNRKTGVIALAIASLYGFSRVYVGIHYPLDVLGGAVIGILTSYGVYRLLPILEPLPSWLLRLGRRLYLA
ncbi:MAG: phosphatase PAP2 family protein [Chloroflexi bacterium]|nr:phosphatase PAP2 family protein [Chloroflexota bacterium]